MKIGGEDVEFSNNFRLLLQTKLPNPHYKPEIAAQCTLVNFTVTPEGLEEQFLAMIVNAEQPELETSKQALTRKQNEFKVTLAQLEDKLLFELSNADPELILANTTLVESLEETKRTTKEIQQQVKHRSCNTSLFCFIDIFNYICSLAWVVMLVHVFGGDAFQLVLPFA